MIICTGCGGIPQQSHTNACIHTFTSIEQINIILLLNGITAESCLRLPRLPRFYLPLPRWLRLFSPNSTVSFIPFFIFYMSSLHFSVPHSFHGLTTQKARNIIPWGNKKSPKHLITCNIQLCICSLKNANTNLETFFIVNDHICFTFRGTYWFCGIFFCIHRTILFLSTVSFIIIYPSRTRSLRGKSLPPPFLLSLSQCSLTWYDFKSLQNVRVPLLTGLFYLNFFFGLQDINSCIYIWFNSPLSLIPMYGNMFVVFQQAQAAF